MKLIQVNAWLGRLNGPLERFITTEAPDFVCMQEAFAPGSESLYVFHDQYQFTDEVIRKGKFPHSFFNASWGFEMSGKVIDEGNIILSKYPIRDKVSFHTHKQYSLRKIPDNSANTRAWQACRVQLPGGNKLSIANYQGYVTGSNPAGDNVTIQTMSKAAEGLKRLQGPIIFCGDLNVAPNSPAMKVLDELNLINLTAKYALQTTLSSAHRAPEKDRHNVACDYIFVSPEIKVVSFSASEEVVSDHKALILEFEL